RLMRRVSLAAVAAAGLTAFALLPQALAILASNRRVLVATPLYVSLFSWVPHAPLWPGWRTTIFPQAFGDGIESPMLPVVWGAFTEMSLGDVGIVAWALAPLLLRPGSRRARITVSLLAAIVVALGIGLGAWPFTEI